MPPPPPPPLTPSPPPPPAACATGPLVRFLPYQRGWLQDESRFKIGMFARQTGKTFTTCAEIVRDCLRAETEGRRVRWVILSRGERQAAEAMEEAVKPFCKAFQTLYQAARRAVRPPAFSEEAFHGDSGAVYKALEVRFPRGSRITALPANPDTARGYSANVFLDEFAFHRDSRTIWKALFPVVSKAGLRLRVTSTPNGRDNKFHELWSSTDALWSRHQVDIHAAVRQGLDRDVSALRAALNDEDAWAQEYELQFLDEASAWLGHDLISAAEHADAGRPENYRGGEVFIGNDIARRRDLWVAWVWERVTSPAPVLWTREIVTLKNASFAEQDAALDRLMARYRVCRLAMDRTGMGEKPVEDAIRRYGGGRVEGVMMAGARPLTIATLARQAFEDRSVRIPAADPDLRGDLHKIRKVIGATGAPRIVASRDGAGHADRAWACFLGLAAADAGSGTAYGYQPVDPDDDDDDDAGRW